VNTSGQYILKLRGFLDSDQSRLAELCDNKNIWNNVRDIFPSPYTLKNAEEFIRSCQAENPCSTFAIEFNSELAGCIGLVKQTDIYIRSAELGYWIGEPYWGKGIATRAVKQIVDYGFTQLGLTRIYAGVFEYNHASRRVLEKSGFILEGVLKKAVYKNDTFCDEYRYAKIIEL